MTKNAFFAALAATALCLASCGGNEPDPLTDAVKAKIAESVKGLPEDVRIDHFELIDSSALGTELSRCKDLFRVKIKRENELYEKYQRNAQYSAASAKVQVIAKAQKHYDGIEELEKKFAAQKDSIIRMFETGPLPKMVATSPDGKYLAVTHWGDNTVGIMDISSSEPSEWKYVSCVVVDYKLNLNYSLTHKVDRDVNSGYCLRGTVFSEDGKVLLVGCMGGSGGIAVIDLENMKYLGRATGNLSNLRHLLVKDGVLFASINRSGIILRMPLDTFLSKVRSLDGDRTRTVAVDGWQSCKVPSGARTINISPKGDFIFVACNSSSCLAVVDAVAMKLLGTLPADSYPVGLDISDDGKYLFTTSQGRGNGGGNAVDIFEVEYK